MLEIFLEEANEVLTAMESSLAQARSSDNDALINIRRAFHTLKGSARMVGLTAFGECGWEMEQVMNHWLAQGLTVTPELLSLCADARDVLSEWAHALQGEDAPGIDAGGIAQRARALRGEAPVAPAAQPTPAPAVPVVAPTPLPAEAAVRAVTDPRGLQTVLMPADPDMRADTAEFMTMQFNAKGQSAAPLAPAPSAPRAADKNDGQEFLTVMMPAQITAPSYETTLNDLGERLSWLNGLVEDMQEQASASGTVNARLNEIALMMGESMSEAISLHRTLQEQLAAKP